MLFLSAIAGWHRRRRGAMPRPFVAAAAIAIVGGLLFGPQCLCVDPTAQLVGTLATAALATITVFGIAAAALSMLWSPSPSRD